MTGIMRRQLQSWRPRMQRGTSYTALGNMGNSCCGFGVVAFERGRHSTRVGEEGRKVDCGCMTTAITRPRLLSLRQRMQLGTYYHMVSSYYMGIDRSGGLWDVSIVSKRE